MSGPRDFLDEDYVAPEKQTYKPRDFLETEQPKESFGEAAKYAIPRIAEDLYHKGYEGIQAVPEYWNKYKTELPGFWSNVFKHPGHMAMQGFAGANEAVNGINQLLPTAAQYAHDRLHLLPEGGVNAIKRFAPEDTTEAINQLFDQPKYPGEALFRGTIRNAPELGTAAKLLEAAPHLTKYGATKRLKQAKKLASERDIGTLNVNPELIEDARQFLPNILRNREALDASHAGDYNSLFKLQSDVGKISANRMGKLKKLFSPETHITGEAGNEARHNLLGEIHSNLQNLGHEDISRLLREGQNDYRRYMNFRKYPRALGAAGVAYAAPKNPLTDLMQKLWSLGG